MRIALLRMFDSMRTSGTVVSIQVEARPTYILKSPMTVANSSANDHDGTQHDNSDGSERR